MPDEELDDDVLDDDETPADTADDDEPAPKPKPKAEKPKPGKGKADKPRPKGRPGSAAAPTDPDDDEADPDDDHVTVDRRAYERKLEKLNALEAADRDRKRRARDRAQQETDKLANKDWPKAKKLMEAQHRTEIEDRDNKIAAYENRLRRQTLAESIRAGFDTWNEKNPQRRVRPNMAKHLATALEKRVEVEWDDVGGDDGKGEFVAVDPVTNRPAVAMIQEWLRHDDFAGFLEASTQGGAGGRGGGVRPGTGSGSGGTKDDKGSKNPYAAFYNQAMEDRGKAGNGVRPSIGLSRAGAKPRDN